MFAEDSFKPPDPSLAPSIEGKQHTQRESNERECVPSQSMPDNKEFTLLWAQARDGDRDALSRLTGLISPELRRIAHILLNKERKSHTLTANALVNELYIRLLGNDLLTINDRNHFLAIASKRMRFILIDYARRRNSQKNNNGVQPETLNDNARKKAVSADKLDLLIDIDKALQELEKIHPGWARVVELRYFGGCKFHEIAEILRIHQRRAERYWAHARTWLFNFMQDDALS